jgi:hypothetical protein
MHPRARSTRSSPSSPASARRPASSASSISSSWDGARRGVAEAREVIRRGSTAQQAAKLDMHREIDFKNPILDRYTKTIFRSLSAADQVYRGMALARSIDEQARVVARSEGLKGSARRARISQLVAAPTDEMSVRAMADAELATFNNNGVLAQVAAGARKPLGPIGDIVLPFARTPANVATRVAEYSPLGAASAAGEILVAAMKGKGISAELQRKIADRLGRSATGASAIAVGYYLAAQGKLNAGRPTTGSGKADEFDLEGKTPNAVLIDGKWHALNRFSPVGNLLTLGAHIYNASQDPDATAATVGMRAVTGIGQNVTEQSFLRGTSDLIDAVKGAPGAPERYLENTAGSIVPAAVSRIAGAVDPAVREVHGVSDALESRIPGLSKRLEPKVNQLGEDVEREQGLARDVLRSDERAHRSPRDGSARRRARARRRAAHEAQAGEGRGAARVHRAAAPLRADARERAAAGHRERGVSADPDARREHDRPAAGAPRPRSRAAREGAAENAARGRDAIAAPLSDVPAHAPRADRRRRAMTHERRRDLTPPASGLPRPQAPPPSDL